MPTDAQLKLIYIEAIKSKPELLQYIDDQNEELCLLAIKKNPECILYVKNITDNIKKVLITTYPLAIKHLLSTENDYVLYVNSVQNVNDLDKIPKENITESVKLAIINRFPSYIQTIPIKEQTIEQINTALLFTPLNIQYVNQDLVSDNNLALLVLKDFNILPHIKKERLTQNLCDIAVNGNTLLIKNVPECYQTVQLCTMIAKRAPFYICHIVNQTEEICLIALKTNPKAYQYIKNPTQQHIDELLKQGIFPTGGLKKYSIQNIEHIVSKVNIVGIDLSVPISQDIIMRKYTCANAKDWMQKLSYSGIISNNMLYYNDYCIPSNKKDINKVFTYNQVMQIIMTKYNYDITDIVFTYDSKYISNINKLMLHHYKYKEFNNGSLYYFKRNKKLLPLKLLLSIILCSNIQQAYGRNSLTRIPIEHKIYIAKKYIKWGCTYFPDLIFNLKISDDDLKKIILSYIDNSTNTPVLFTYNHIERFSHFLSQDIIKKYVLQNKLLINCVKNIDDDFLNKVLKKFPSQILSLFDVGYVYKRKPSQNQIIKGLEINPNYYWNLPSDIQLDVAEEFYTIMMNAIKNKDFNIPVNNVTYALLSKMAVYRDELWKIILSKQGSFIDFFPDTNPLKEVLANIALDTYPLAIKYINKNKQTVEQCTHVLTNNIYLYTFCNFIPDNFHNAIFANKMVLKYIKPVIEIDFSRDIIDYEIINKIKISPIKVYLEFAKLGKHKLIPKAQYQNYAFIKELQKFDYTALFHIDKPTMQDYIQAVKLNGLVLWAVTIQTDEICMLALEQNPEAIVYVHTQTEEICKYVYEKNQKLLIFFDDKFNYLTDLPK